jgi:hypothetical protein
MRATIRFVMAFAGLFFAREVLADDGGTSVYYRTFRNPEGNAFVRATPIKPVYYQPLFFGYREEGRLVKFYTKNPPLTAHQTAQAEQQLVKELAAQGYRIATKLSPASLIITFEWGYKAYGSEMYRFPENQNYFLQISALDLKASQQHKRVQLWMEEVEMPRWGNYIDGVLPTMIATGTAAFGKPPGPYHHVGGPTAEYTFLTHYNQYSIMTTQLIPGLDRI